VHEKMGGHSAYFEVELHPHSRLHHAWAFEGQQDVEELEQDKVEHSQSMGQEEVYGQKVQVQVQVEVDYYDECTIVGSSHGFQSHFVVFQEIFAQEQAVDVWEVSQDDAHFFQPGVQHSGLAEVM
jgi:hypothetical protein